MLFLMIAFNKFLLCGCCFFVWLKNKYVLLNAPNDQLSKIISLLPGMKSPTVLPLASPGWSSVHSVIAESDFWEIIEQLKAAGAEGILVIPIEKMIL